MNTIFDFKRAGLLIQRHFIERFRGELMFWGVSLICMMFMRNSIQIIAAYAIISCIIRTGKSFREIHSPTNQINYFMIPATRIEKFAVSLFYTIVCFWSMALIVYVAGNILGTWINNLLANIGLLSALLNINHSDLQWVVFNFPPNVLDLIATINGILLLQSLFLLGSIYFKRNQVLITCLALVIIGTVLGLIIGIEAKYFLVDTLKTMSEFKNNIALAGNPWIKSLEITSKIFYYLLVPYLWFTSYIRLTEKEV